MFYSTTRIKINQKDREKISVSIGLNQTERNNQNPNYSLQFVVLSLSTAPADESLRFVDKDDLLPRGLSDPNSAE